jgi:hypothetical protein
MMAGSDCAAALVSAIGDFAKMYGHDKRFTDVIASLRRSEGAIEQLAPTSDAADRESPGRRAAREVAEEAAERSSSSGPASSTSGGPKFGSPEWRARYGK